MRRTRRLEKAKSAKALDGGNPGGPKATPGGRRATRRSPKANGETPRRALAIATNPPAEMGVGGGG